MSEEECEISTPYCNPTAFGINILICMLLIATAGMMAGLTMGLLSLDKLNILILKMEGSLLEKRYAAKVAPIVDRHHFLLVTLLLVNAGANEALPIFLHRLVPEAISILLSVTCVLLFGEILPSAIFTGPQQLQIAAFLSPLVKFLMIVTSPISYPISKVLDYCFGDDHALQKYKRNELKALIALQKESQQAKLHRLDRARMEANIPYCRSFSKGTFTKVDIADYGNLNSEFPTPHRELHSAHGTRLHLDEVTIIHGALDLSSKTVVEVMIPIAKVYMLEHSTKLNQNVMADILASGHSRIPVYKEHPSNIIGLLLVKRLIVVDPDDQRAVKDLCLRKPIVTTPDESCYSILNEFQKGRSHIALLTKEAQIVEKCWEEEKDIPPNVEFVGIVTIEDVIEELIQEEIEDESDMYVQGIVNHWRSKAKKHTFHPAGKSFVKTKLKALAERARLRVRDRKLLLSGSDLDDLRNRSMIQVLSPSHFVGHSDSTQHLEIISESTPLINQ